MVDRLYDDSNQKALEMVARMDVNDLRSGIYTEKLPYFLEMMEKSGLDYRNPEHCSIVGRSIEARLQSDSHEIIKLVKEENLETLIDEPILDETMSKFKQLFFSECKRVNNSVISIYKRFVYNPVNLGGFSQGFFNDKNYDSIISPRFLGLFFLEPRIHLNIHNKSLDISWYYEKDINYPLYTIKLWKSDDNKIISSANFNRSILDLDDSGIKVVYDYYFNNPKLKTKELDYFRRAFNLLKVLPERLERSLEDGKTKWRIRESKQEEKRRDKEFKTEKKLKKNAIVLEKEAIFIAKRLSGGK